MTLLREAIRRSPPPVLLGAAAIVMFLGWRGSETTRTVISNDPVVSKEAHRFQSSFQKHLTSLQASLEEELRSTDRVLQSNSGDYSRNKEPLQLYVERLTGLESITLYRKSTTGPYEVRMSLLASGRSAPDFPISLAEGGGPAISFESKADGDGRRHSFAIHQGGDQWLAPDQIDGVRHICHVRTWTPEDVPDQWLAVHLFDQDEVSHYLNGYLNDWLHENTASMRREHLGFQISDGEGKTHLVAWQPVAQRPADHLIVVDSILGTWNLRIWLPVTVRHSRSPLILTSSALLAFALVLAAAAAARQRRRTRLYEASQVSFLTRITHDLRTPLTNLLLGLDLAESHLEDGDKAGAEARIRSLRGDVLQLGNLLDNALDHTRGIRRSEPILSNPEETLTGIVSSFQAGLDARHITLEIRGLECLPGQARFHRDVLTRILSNLMENARNHAADGKWIGLTVSHRDGWLHVIVSDRGPGLCVKKRRLFATLSGIGESSPLTSARGTGLGLLLSSELAALAGGSLRLLPSETGACFEVMLPMEPIATS